MFYNYLVIPDDGQSKQTQWFWVLYNIVRTFQNVNSFVVRKHVSKKNAGLKGFD
jgi:hypothetical protein